MHEKQFAVQRQERRGRLGLLPWLRAGQHAMMLAARMRLGSGRALLVAGVLLGNNQVDADGFSFRSGCRVQFLRVVLRGIDFLVQITPV